MQFSVITLLAVAVVSVAALPAPAANAEEVAKRDDDSIHLYIIADDEVAKRDEDSIHLYIIADDEVAKRAPIDHIYCVASDELAKRDPADHSEFVRC